MMIKEYIEFVKEKSMVTGGDLKCAHGISGLITELGELEDCFKRHRFYGLPLDEVNILEELGDLLFYITEYCIGLEQTMGVPQLSEKLLSRCPSDNKELEKSAKWAIEVGVFTLIATAEGEGPDFFMERLNSIISILFGIILFGRIYDFSLKQIIQKNMDKLNARYKKKLTKEEYLNRNVEREREILNG